MVSALALDGPMRAILAIPMVTAAPATVLPGGTVTAAVNGASWSTYDWIGVAPVGSSDVTPIAAQVCQRERRKDLVLPRTINPGNYEVRLMRSGFRVATSNPINVPAPKVSVSAATVGPGRSFLCRSRMRRGIC